MSTRENIRLITRAPYKTFKENNFAALKNSHQKGWQIPRTQSK